MVEAMSPADKLQLSAAWLSQIHASTSTDVWLHGFKLLHRDIGIVVGTGGFTGPPITEGVVEIAYGVDPDHQGKGFATEAAEAMTNFAFGFAEVRVVRAHTRPESNASARVLTRRSWFASS